MSLSHAKLSKFYELNYLIRVVVILVPGLVLLPMLFAPLPNYHHLGVELAGYFQALAFLRTGLGSYTFLTPAESASALHLHSLLSAPLLALGIMQAGRIISWLAALSAAYLVYKIATEYTSWRIGLLSVALLWSQPLFVEFASRWYPESLSIALTVTSIYVTLKSQNDQQMYLLSLFFLGISITNHMWEASIALPLTFLYLKRREVLRAFSVILVTCIGIGFVEYVKSFQPKAHGLVSSYSIFTHPGVAFSYQWFFRGGALPPGLDPYLTIISWTVPAAFLLVAYHSYKLITTWRRSTRLPELHLLLAAWLVSALTILVLLPLGWRYHPYYAWGLLAPIALSGAHFLQDTARAFADRFKFSSSQLISGLLLFVIVFALVYSSIFVVGNPTLRHAEVPGYKQGTLQSAGLQIKADGVTSVVLR